MIKFCKVKLVMKIFRLVRQTSVACVSIYLVIFNVLCPLHEIYSSRVILSFPVITSKIVQTIHCTTLRNYICLKSLYNKNLIISNHFKIIFQHFIVSTVGGRIFLFRTIYVRSKFHQMNYCILCVQMGHLPSGFQFYD